MGDVNEDSGVIGGARSVGTASESVLADTTLSVAGAMFSARF